MLVRFWGTRGSLPVALKANAVREKLVTALMAAGGRRFEDSQAAGRFIDDELDFAESGTYGGASSCVELEGGDGEFVIFDMGSGLREFALSAVERTKAGRSKVYNFFLSHLHWDHIMGFPFFAPAFDPEAEIRIYGGHRELELALRRQQEKISFPVPFGWLKAKFSFTTLEPGETYDIAGYRVDLFRQAHDNDSFGYRLESGGKSVVYSTDGEYKADDREREDAFVGFIDKADLVIFDTMYSLAEAVSMKEDWGHSSNVTAVDLCHRAEVKRLAMFHHEPVNDDRAIRQIHRDTIRYEELMRHGAPLEVLCSYDGLELSV